MSAIVHPPSEVLSLRHGPSWILLALAAGSVNAGAFLACERFVAHLTGTVTRIGLDAGAWKLVLDYGLVLVSFIVGAMASVLAVQARVIRRKRPMPGLTLALVAAILVGVAAIGKAGAFGPVGGLAGTGPNFLLLCILAFAMGLMNATVASTTALSIRTTHMTGPASDFGVHLATAWFATGEERVQALRNAALRGGKIAAFAVGAMLMVHVMPAFGYAAFVLPAACVVIAAVRSFLPLETKSDLRARLDSAFSNGQQKGALS